MVWGSLAAPKDPFLIIEKSVNCQMCLLLIGTFYVVNMVYTKGLNNFFCFMECSLMGQRVNS